MQQDNIVQVDLAIKALRDGKMIILFDSSSRENEGDFVMAAEHVTPSTINFMITVARGLLCVPMLGCDLDRMGLPQMVKYNTALHQCAFTVSVDAASGILTGSSAFDRAHTIRTLLKKNVTLDHFAVPGHVFPVRCHSEGLTGRQGHTEGSIALMELAGLKPVSIICEILNAEGTMARLPDLNRLAIQYQMPLVSIQDLISCLKK